LAARRPVAPVNAALPVAALGAAPAATTPTAEVVEEDKPHRSARIVSAEKHEVDARVVEREKLLGRLLASEGRGAITRAADQFIKAGFAFPVEQPVQLQLLEHHDEALVRDAIDALRVIVAQEAPLKRPVFEQRLRRLEDSAEEEATRLAASDLRRALRT
jgi:hypothetical protein